jgi:HEPN domain-containing protein
LKRSRELAELLLRKAAHDEYAFEKLSEDPNAPDEIVFFHAQQAVEKMIKAVLALSSVRFRRTHDLAGLIDLARDSGIRVPSDLERVTDLTPFAANFRYEDVPPETSMILHLHRVAEWVRRTRAWAESILREHSVKGES